MDDEINNSTTANAQSSSSESAQKDKLIALVLVLGFLALSVWMIFYSPYSRLIRLLSGGAMIIVSGIAAAMLITEITRKKPDPDSRA